MKKWFALLMAMILLLSACGTGAGKETEQPAAEADVEETATGLQTEQSVGESTEETARTRQDLEIAVDFRFYDRRGNGRRLSEFLGNKPVILNFWASWCGPCKAEMPAIQEAYLEYGSQIEFLMVNLTDGVNETVETAGACISSQGYTFPIYFDSDYAGIKAYNVSAIPLTLFINADGYIVYTHTGMLSEQQLRQGIDMIMN